MYQYDLQVHTNLSDGDYPLETVLTQAKEAGLKGLVITDHNVARGINHKAKLARRQGFESVSGIEISCKYEGIEVHILGYARTFNETLLTQSLQATIDGYNERSR